MDVARWCCGPLRHPHRCDRVLGEPAMKWIIFWSFAAILLLGAFLLECGPS